MFKKSIILLVSSVLMFSILLPFGGTYSKASSNNEVTVGISKNDDTLKVESVPTIEQPPIEPYGVKSKAVVKVAQLLKAGGDEVIDAAKTFKIIDSATAKTFKSNSKKIGNYLDRFENAGANAANEVRSQLPGWLKENTRMSKGVAENISIAVSWAIRGADWLFF
ncbi:hypothetical protein [Guptibacillus hwajinpoensis]|uniref:hypothetical protein n=1 Tax=Guptibacillus hwajinpoensis TaxID=208199 RepID=UPI001CFD5314|nr:hypothetical protein [Pseudalkalibacillus hwajinpoensis]WLR58853.1 hypothetical protein LC071_17050 [Pseudalkalibacillus hwajinpoensis]